MSIVGITIDYGPFGFMDRFMWDHVCNSSDTSGHYSYAQQPSVCQWNCARLAECLVQSILSIESNSTHRSNKASFNARQSELHSQFKDVLDTHFMDTFQLVYSDRMRKKLGLFARPKDDDTQRKDERLVKSLLDTMERTGADFTNTFLALEEILERAVASMNDDSSLTLHPDAVIEECCSVAELAEAYAPTDADMQWQRLSEIMGFSHRFLQRLDEPKVLKSAEKTRRYEKYKHMTDSEKRSHDAELWQTWLDAYAARLMEDMLLEPTYSWSDRLQLMRCSNPCLILRNHLAEVVIKAAEAGNFTCAKQLLDDLRQPFALPEASPTRKLISQAAPEEDIHVEPTPTCRLPSGLRPRVHRPDWARALRVS
ncbi:unnamed protein product [Dicrocoelium dendriticum]|nr:unnamed protein product [Dicrocoelium dendriticum]